MSAIQLTRSQRRLLRTSKILTRYPVMERSDEAKARLLALKQPVPRPTKAMLAQNKAEEAARREPTTMAAVMAVLSRHPDVSAATNVGEPPLQDQDSSVRRMWSRQQARLH